MQMMGIYGNCNNEIELRHFSALPFDNGGQINFCRIMRARCACVRVGVNVEGFKKKAFAREYVRN